MNTMPRFSRLGHLCKTAFAEHPLTTLALAVVLSAAALLAPASSAAHEGHDDAPSPVQSGSALPRVTAHSDLFEMVGVLQGQQLTIYLDHAATNEPVKNATLELDVNGTALEASPHGDGEFLAQLPAPAAGTVAVTATIVAGADADLLTGDLVITDAAGADAHADHGPGAGMALMTAALLGAVAILAIVVIRRRNRASSAIRKSGDAA